MINTRKTRGLVQPHCRGWNGAHIKEYSVAALRAIPERHFSFIKILSSKSGGRPSEDCDSGQKMVALCR
jgi:hypothetical protein